MTHHSLYKICYYDKFSSEILTKYMRDYGDVLHSNIDTTLNNELGNYKSKKLYDLLEE